MVQLGSHLAAFLFSQKGENWLEQEPGTWGSVVLSSLLSRHGVNKDTRLLG